MSAHGFRRLDVSVSGKWYIVLTIVLGVVALVSGNNVLYLSESLLLSGLILSGILSERAISGVEVRVLRGSAAAGETAHDQVRVVNRRRSPVFCVEIGEWRGKRRSRIAFVARLAPLESLSVPSEQVIPTRGTHDWDGWYVATSYPFGFARKLRLVDEKGTRKVWPARLAADEARDGGARDRQRPLHGTELAEGEIRPYVPDDDWRLVVWTLSSRGGDPVVRMRRAEGTPPEITLDLASGEKGEAFERQVRAAAHPFHSHADGGGGGGGGGSAPVLNLIETTGRRRLRGKRRALDELALVAPGGGRRSAK